MKQIAEDTPVICRFKDLPELGTWSGCYCRADEGDHVVYCKPTGYDGFNWYTFLDEEIEITPPKEEMVTIPKSEYEALLKASQAPSLILLKKEIPEIT